MENDEFVETDGQVIMKKSRFEGSLKQKANTAVVYYCNVAFVSNDFISFALVKKFFCVRTSFAKFTDVEFQGVCVAFFAPALVEFMKGFQTDMKTMSTLMTVGTALGLVSSLGC